MANHTKVHKEPRNPPSQELRKAYSTQGVSLERVAMRTNPNFWYE